MPGLIKTLAGTLAMLAVGFAAGALYGPSLFLNSPARTSTQTEAPSSNPKLSAPPLSSPVGNIQADVIGSTPSDWPWLVLAGTTTNQVGPPSALIGDCTGTQRTYKVGQLVADGYQLTNVRTSSARLEKSGQSLTLQMGQRSRLADRPMPAYPLQAVDPNTSQIAFAAPLLLQGNLNPELPDPNMYLIPEEEAERMFTPATGVDEMFEPLPEEHVDEGSE